MDRGSPFPCTVSSDQRGRAGVLLSHDLVHCVPTAPRTASSKNISWGGGASVRSNTGKAARVSAFTDFPRLSEEHVSFAQPWFSSGSCLRIFRSRKCLPLETFPVEPHDLSGAWDGIQVLLRKPGSLAVHPGPARAPSVPGSFVRASKSHQPVLAPPSHPVPAVRMGDGIRWGAGCTEDGSSRCGASGQGLLHPLLCWRLWVLTPISQANYLACIVSAWV